MLTKGIKGLALLFIFALTISIIPINVKAADEGIYATIEIIPLSVEDADGWNVRISDIDRYKKQVRIDISSMFNANADGSYTLKDSSSYLMVFSSEEMNKLGWSMRDRVRIGEDKYRLYDLGKVNKDAVITTDLLAQLFGFNNDTSFRDKQEVIDRVSHKRFEVYGICPKRSVKVTICRYESGEPLISSLSIEKGGKSYSYDELFGSHAKCTLTGKRGTYALTSLSANNSNSEDRVFFLKPQNSYDNSDIDVLSYAKLSSSVGGGNTFEEYYYPTKKVYVKNASKETRELKLVICFSGYTREGINSTYYSPNQYASSNFITVNSSNVETTFKNINMVDSMKHFDFSEYRSSTRYFLGKINRMGETQSISTSHSIGTCDVTATADDKLSVIDNIIIGGLSYDFTSFDLDMLSPQDENVIVVNLASNFVPHTYNVAYDLPSDAINAASNPKKTKLYVTHDLKSPSRPGYTFTGWSVNNRNLRQFNQAIILPTDEAPADNTFTLSAGWTPNTYKIEYEMNDGYFTTTSEDVLVKSYKTGDEDIIIPTDVEKDGYVFEGWYDNANCKGDTITKISKGTYGDQHLYAKFTPKIYDINYELNDGVLPEDAPTTHTAFTTVNLKAPTREDYTFIGWFETEDFSDYIVTKILPGRSEDITLYAKWRLTADIEAEKEAEAQAKKQKEEEAEKARYDAIEAKEVPVNDVDIKDEDIVNDVSVNEYKAPEKQETTPTVKPTTDEAEKEPTKVVVDTSKVKFVKLKNIKGKKLKVLWKKKKGSYTYEVQYSVNKNFKKAKTKSVTTNKLLLNKLKLNKKYYVRVRSVKEVDGVKVYGKWSAKRKIVIKK